MLELLRREFDSGMAVVVATDRADGDVHPIEVEASVLRSRQRSVAGREWTMVDQVHGTDLVRCVGDTSAWPIAGVGDVVVGCTGPLAIWAGDCAELMLLDGDGCIVGCHAGWRGLAAGVIDVAAAVAPRPVAAVLGPCIHPCCYEFGERDLARVARGVGVTADVVASSTATGALALDVPAAVGAALGRRGIELDAIGPCTGCDDRWYSHRRGDQGRHAVVAWYENTAVNGSL